MLSLYNKKWECKDSTLYFWFKLQWGLPLIAKAQIRAKQDQHKCEEKAFLPLYGQGNYYYANLA